MGWLFHFNNGTLRKLKLPLTYAVSLSGNIVSTCRRSITGKATTVYSDKINLEFPLHVLSRTSFVPWQWKASKMLLISNRKMFYPTVFFLSRMEKFFK